MQFTKWTIIILLLIFFFPEECQASFSRKEAQKATCSLRSENSSLEYIIDNIISFLSSNPGDITEYCFHNSYDKKTFLRLFIHSEDTHVLPPSISPYGNILLKSRFTFSTPVDRYVYMLQKIVI